MATDPLFLYEPDSNHHKHLNVYERYPISGIKQSYRPHSGTRTVVIPVLITALGIGMVIFYFKGKPPLVKAATVETPGIAVKLETPGIAAKTGPLPISPVGAEPGAKTTVLPESKSAGVSLPLLTRTDIADSDFTLWMSPLALDTYIRQKNRGFEQTFWERGHWIKAVEGRWEKGGHEFRIAFAANPDPDRLQWYYRIDQTESEFSEALRRFQNDGYTLVQSHAYDHPDGTKRFQGVWQREIQGAKVASDPPGVIGSRSGPQALDVGDLNFR